MSEFRIFCLWAFFGSGLFSAFMNHVVKPPRTGNEAVEGIVMMLLFGCVGVAFFGKRATDTGRSYGE